MAKQPMYNNWTWKVSLPPPFDKLTSNISTTDYSQYCTTKPPKATLHSASLQAILAYLEMDTSVTPASTSQSAIGTQGDKLVAEYHSRTGELHAIVFNKKNGKFFATRYDSAVSTSKVYTIKESGNTGAAVFFVLMPLALEDDEFKDHYDQLSKCRNNGFTDLEKAASSACILCDNLYRRIENADRLGNAGIRIVTNSTGNLPQITALNLSRGSHSPSNVLFGTFQALTAATASTGSITINRDDFSRHYPLSERTFTSQEELMIPTLEDWYIIPPEVLSICKHAQATTDGNLPMRNFMMRGPSGTGKTEGAKAIAAGLGLPYMYYTCSANSEIYDFLGQMLPVTDESGNENAEYPTFEDIQMDPPSAYRKLTGIYDEAITDYEVYEKLKELIYTDARADGSKAGNGQQFRYVESPLITAIRKGYVIEIQEPTVIANPGVLVGLNALLDRCASVTLITGEVIRRHPDTVVVVTTNNNYAGCRDINQSVISRMNLIIDVEEPGVNVLAERAMKVTGCTDRAAVMDMASSVIEISERCKETMINDGSCGARELYSWIQSFMVNGDILESSKYTVLSSVSSDADNRADILSCCLEPKYAA